MVGTFLWNLIKIRWVVSVKKMFKEKVNARTHGRTTNTGPWHKLAGLWPVELKKKHYQQNSYIYYFIVVLFH